MDERRRTLLAGPPGDGGRAPGGIVVGVDGTAANWSAVSWAAAEARATGRPLRLVAASTSTVAPALAPVSESRERDREHLELTRDLLGDVRSRLGTTPPDISTQISTGEPAHALVAAPAPDDLLVVGKRGGHPLSHIVLGSTSMAAAGGCRAPVVV